MGINVEFNPDLALRDFSEYRESRRRLEECLPEVLVQGQELEFLKKGQRCYWLHGQCPLLRTNGDLSVGEARLSRPLAAITILEATHFVEGKEVYTRGRYRVEKVLSQSQIGFVGFKRVEN